MDDIPPISDEADAPIIVPPPGQILRRAARTTKMRKTSVPAAGEGRGFSGRRRRPRVTESRTSSDISSNDHASEQVDTTEQYRRPRTFSNESITSDEQTSHRSDPYGEETSIYDAYVREDPDNEIVRSMQSFMTPEPPILSLTLPADDSKLPSADVAPEPPLAYPPPQPELQHPQPQRLNLAAPIEETPRTPSPDTTLVSTTEETAVASTMADIPVFTEKPARPAPKKENRRGLFGKWSGGDKTGKKTAKVEREKETQRAEKEKEKDREKESGFFGSLFSGKKKQDDSSSQTSGYTGSGRETAAALLGASKSSKGLPTSPSPQPGFQGPYARYPIHVERAIYRLSHIKLANPRRPLYEQVLISNLMFWYLGVINKTQNPTPAVSPTQEPATATPGQPVSEQEEAQRREAEERQEAENERLERGKQEPEREQKERERELQLQQQQQKEKSRRGTLTKANPTQQGSRRAGEMLVKGPQYEMQHRVMEQEYHGPGYGYGSSSPSPPRIHRQASPPINQPQQPVDPEPSAYMYPGGMDPHLPLGVMSPIPNSLPASPAATRDRPPSSSPPPTNLPLHADSPPQTVPTNRSRSPPSQNHNRYSASSPGPGPGRSQPSRGPMRSLSATASPGVPLSADGKPRKVVSARAVAPSPNGRPRASIGSLPVSRGEEEDVPLAVYQQQRRR